MRVPAPGSLATCISPPWLSMIRCDIDMPSPVPTLTSLVVKNGSNMRLQRDGTAQSALFWQPHLSAENAEYPVNIDCRAWYCLLEPHTQFFHNTLAMRSLRPSRPPIRALECAAATHCNIPQSRELKASAGAWPLTVSVAPGRPKTMRIVLRAHAYLRRYPPVSLAPSPGRGYRQSSTG